MDVLPSEYSENIAMELLKYTPSIVQQSRDEAAALSACTDLSGAERQRHPLAHFYCILEDILHCHCADIVVQTSYKRSIWMRNWQSRRKPCSALAIIIREDDLSFSR